MKIIFPEAQAVVCTAASGKITPFSRESVMKGCVRGCSTVLLVRIALLLAHTTILAARK
jgi:hypothetical protein